MTDGQRFWVMALCAAWALAFALSSVAYLVVDRPGLSREAAFLGWQAIAGILAVAIWGVGRGWPRGSGVKRLSVVPLTLALVVAGLALVVSALP